MLFINNRVLILASLVALCLLENSVGVGLRKNHDELLLDKPSNHDFVRRRVAFEKVEKQLDELRKIKADAEDVEKLRSGFADLANKMDEKKEDPTDMAEVFGNGLENIIKLWTVENDTTGTLSAAFGLASDVAMMVPGGQPVAFILSTVSMVCGLFEKVPDEPPPLTAEIVAKVVRTELWRAYEAEFVQIEGPVLARKLQAQVKTLIEIYRYKDRPVGFGKDALKLIIQDATREVTGKLNKGWILYGAKIDHLSKDKNPFHRRCEDTCALMTVLLDDWLENPQNPNVHKYAKYWSKPDAPRGRGDIHFNEGNPDDVRMKHCYGWFAETRPGQPFQDGAYSENKECIMRVLRMKQCRDDFNLSQRNRKDVSGLYAVTESINRLSLMVFTLAVRLFKMDDKILDDPSSLYLLGNQLSEPAWKLASVSLDRSLTFVDPSNKKRYRCNDPQKGWLEVAGKFPRKGESDCGGYDPVTKLLKWSSCARPHFRQVFQRSCPGGQPNCGNLGMCEPKHRCPNDRITTMGEHVNYRWEGPGYSYEVLQNQEGMQEFSLNKYFLPSPKKILKKV